MTTDEDIEEMSAISFFASYLKQYRGFVLLFLICGGIFLGAFYLYHLPVEAVLYPVLLSALVCVIFGAYDFSKARKKHKRLQEIASLRQEIQNAIPSLLKSLPEKYTTDDGDYIRIIELLAQERNEFENQINIKVSDMTEYYTIWAHQIKTPIASMRLHLQNEGSPLSQRLSADLFRIEQYVEMAMMFLRLDSESTDYVIKEYLLDDIIKNAVRKFADDFIARKLTLDYKETGARVVTDEKWLSFVIEQVISNALKYTPSGGVTIEMKEPGILSIRDTGIGIAPEDLPRIFEKGYTGYTGREDKKASGIGLYLCKRICKNLGHSISASSVPDEGTEIRIDLSQRKLHVE